MSDDPGQGHSKSGIGPRRFARLRSSTSILIYILWFEHVSHGKIIQILLNLAGERRIIIRSHKRRPLILWEVVRVRSAVYIP